LALTVDVGQISGRTAAPRRRGAATSHFEGAFGGCAGREKRRELFSAGNELIDAVYTANFSADFAPREYPEIGAI
jgi:hypothetical protein